MALSANTVFEINSGATASNANSGGFNPAATPAITDGVIASGTGNSPTLSSATYSFSAADVTKGVWIYFPTQANITSGWYQIASQSSGVATLKAAVGEAVQWPATGRLGANTVAGVGSAAPTGVSFLVDYSQGTAGIVLTDLGSTAVAPTTLTSTANFLVSYVGNLVHITTTGTGAHGVVGWYELTAYTSTSAMTTDRTTNDGTAMVNSTGTIGGALSLGSSDDAVFELALTSTTIGTMYFIKGNATYTIGGTVTIAADGTSIRGLIQATGYNSIRGDNPTSAQMPVFSCGANIFSCGTFWRWKNVAFTGTAASVLKAGNNGSFINLRAKNISTTANRIAIDGSASNFGQILFCEGVSYRGIGIKVPVGGSGILFGSYAHDSDVGISANGTSVIISGNISACNVTAAIDATTASVADQIIGNTIYGYETPSGIGIKLAVNTGISAVINNIIAGFATGATTGGTAISIMADYNNYYNNTTDIDTAANFQKGKNDIAVNPSFTSITERTGTTATTTSGNHLVQSGALFQTWGVTTADYVYIKSGTGVTAGIYGIASVDSETQITTDVTLAADATANKTWFIIQGRNFLPTGNV